MFVLVLDTETTGLFPRGATSTPLKPPACPSTQRGASQWGSEGGSAPLPYAVQISYAIIDTSSPVFPIVEDYDAIIRISDETPLSPESVAIHGITREMTRSKGVPIEHVLSILQRSLDTYDIQLVVGHNIAFDLRVLSTEYARQGASSAPFNPSRQMGGKGGKAPSPSPSPSPSSSPDPTSTPEGATSAHYAVLQPPPCPSAQIKNSPGTDSNTLSPSRGFKGDGVPLGLRGRPPRDLMRIRSLCTARESVGVCNLRAESMYGGTYLKFGKLGQVFEILFKERDAARGVDMKVFEKYMHNSRVDVLMCARVYVWLCYSVDVFDAWYCEMQNYADENFINVDDAHLVGGGGVEAPLIDRNSNSESSAIPVRVRGASPLASPRRSDRLRLKRMREQEQGSVLAY
jgi:hypothetical protein